MSRELLEKAAKAAGFVLVWGDKYKVGDDEIDCTDIPYIRSGQPDEGDVYWNPLTDDGDALRLAVKRRFHVCIFDACESEGIKSPGFVEVWAEGDADPLHVEHVQDTDYDAATRLAIVRAAAMGEKP